MKTTMRKRAILKAWGYPGDGTGTIVIKRKMCNKPQCGKCPHGFYAYYRLVNGLFKHEQYLGRCTASGLPETNTQLV